MKPANAPAIPDLVAVVMPTAKAAGVRAFGDMVPGTVYRVAPEEAERLVACKGFELAASLPPSDSASATVANPED